MKPLGYVSLVLMTTLIGCGGAADPETSEDRETVFDPLTETIDRAESVQDTVDAQAEALRRQIEEAEGNN
jgi:hypothetical protein